MIQLRVARRRLKNFADESKVTADHHDALECLDCEAFLQLGIDAFDWLIRADTAFRKAVLAGTAHNSRTEEAVESLFRDWLAPCEIARRWIAKLEKRGHHLDNLARFHECEVEVRAVVRFLDDDTLTDAVRALRDEAIAEHERGQTAEFV